jgi:hypothetical protein
MATANGLRQSVIERVFLERFLNNQPVGAFLGAFAVFLGDLNN